MVIASDQLGRVDHLTTAAQMGEEITVLLRQSSPDVVVDVDALVRALIERHGLVHPEYVPEAEFWRLVGAHSRTGG